MAKLDPMEIAKRSALATYRAEAKKDPEAVKRGLSPANATKVAAKKSGIPASRLIPVVAAVYYRENGTRNPVAKKGSFVAAVRKARDAGGPLARWDVLQYRFAAYGKDRVATASLRAAYTAAGGDIDASYTLRGTRAGAPKTRADELAEVASAA
jgi:hypothetical protein